MNQREAIDRINEILHRNTPEEILAFSKRLYKSREVSWQSIDERQEGRSEVIGEIAHPKGN